MPTYTTKFYEDRGFLQSAKHIVPLVMDIVRPKSVIDIGCNTGHFLQVFQDHGVKDIFGVDGKWMDKKLLRIPEKNFLRHNLNEPLLLNRRFDLVVSLEVAEHLPKSSAKSFVNSLTKLGNIILFSAAIPYQGGTHHVNEQWPEYWAAMFEEKGYLPVDAIRKRIWHNNRVNYPYKQNTLLYVHKNILKKSRRLRVDQTEPLSMIHPDLYLSRAKTSKFFLRFIPFSIQKIIVKLRK
jgi:SAM-dependent methyltransferase